MAKKGSDVPPPPNYQPIANASEKQAKMANDLAKAQFKWAQEQWKADHALSEKITGKFMEILDANKKTADADRLRYEKVYQPLEDSFIKSISSYQKELAQSREDYQQGITDLIGDWRVDTRNALDDVRDAGDDWREAMGEGRDQLRAERDRWLAESQDTIRDFRGYSRAQAIKFDRDIAATEREAEREGQRDARRAMATVAQQAEGAREAALRQLESYGINPAATRYAALDRDARVQTAANQAAAGNVAREVGEEAERERLIGLVREERGYADRDYAAAMGMRQDMNNRGFATALDLFSALQNMEGAELELAFRNASMATNASNQELQLSLGKLQAGRDMTAEDIRNINALQVEAINIGRGYPGQIAGQYGVAQGLGNSIVGNANQTTQTGGQLMGTPAQWASVGQGATSNWANILNQQYGNQVDAWKMGQQNPWASALGTGLGMAAAAYNPMQAGWGLIPQMPLFEEGGYVEDEYSPSYGAIPDDIQGRLTAGEYVIPRDAVEWLGEKQLRAFVDKARREREEAAIPLE